MRRVLAGLLVLMIVGFTPSVSGAAEKPYVIFANPAARGDVFFDLMTGFMAAAADDLGFELDVYYGDRNHIIIDENVKAIYSRERLPDYVIGMNARNSGQTMLDLAEQTGVPTVFINQSFLSEKRAEIGQPGERYKQWLFEYLPDDVHAGYLLAKKLILEAYEKGLVKKDGTIDMLAVNGKASSGATPLRAEGLKQALSEHPNVKLRQLVRADWMRDRARKQTKGLLERYPETTIIWSASDMMGLGVSEGIREFGKLPGRDILTGGIDWAALGFDLVGSGDFVTTVGGHFMDGAWALVMLYDHIQGIDFDRPKMSRFSAIFRDNYLEYQTHFGSSNWRQIDFTKFTKAHNPKLLKYDFGLDAMLRQVRN